MLQRVFSLFTYLWYNSVCSIIDHGQGRLNVNDVVSFATLLLFIPIYTHYNICMFPLRPYPTVYIHSRLLSHQDDQETLDKFHLHLFPEADLKKDNRCMPGIRNNLWNVLDFQNKSCVTKVLHHLHSRQWVGWFNTALFCNEAESVEQSKNTIFGIVIILNYLC